jgi:outer membrane protein
MKARSIAVLAVCLAVVIAGGVRVAKAEDKAPSSSIKLGYVDLNRALNEVNEGKAAKAKLEADGKAKKQKLEIMQNDLKKMKDEMDKQKLILSADAMREKENQLQQKFMELQKTSMDYEKSFSDMEASYIKPISDKLQKVIQDIGQKEGFSLIMPKEMALYSLPGSDVTDKVITAYNGAK